MGRIPGWVIRWGISMIFIVMALVVALSYFVKYPETVAAPVVITTQNPPADLIAKSTGKIEKFFISENDTVEVGSVVAVLFNTADYNDIFLLEKLLDGYGPQWDKYTAEEFTDRSFQAGELQSHVSQFIQVCRSYHQYLDMGNIPKKRTILTAQIEKQRLNLGNTRKQLSLLLREFELDRRSLKRDSMFYAEGVISLDDYNRTLQSNLQKQSSIIGYESSIAQTESNILSAEGQLVDLNIQYENELNDFNMQLGASRDQLLAQIALWRDRYVVCSPVKGQVTFIKYWSENQNITAGERLATVVPGEGVNVIGKMNIPSASLGKVSVGQRVDIRLNAYPYTEFGVLRGYLASISAIPDKEGYVAEISFPAGLTSTYGRELAMIQQMDGTGDIVTRDLRLIERFLMPVKSLIYNNVK